MKRFVFQQERLLRIRRQLRRQSELQLLQAQGRLQAARVELRNLETQLAECAAVAVGQVRTSANDPWIWLNRSRSLQQLQSTARQDIQRLEAECVAKSQEVRQRAVAAETLEALKRGKWRSYRQSVEAEKQRELDETAVSLWRRQQECSLEEPNDD